jgi:hypothetical protein
MPKARRDRSPARPAFRPFSTWRQDMSEAQSPAWRETYVVATTLRLGFSQGGTAGGARIIAFAAPRATASAGNAGEDSSQRRRHGTWQQRAATERAGWR